MKRLGVWLVHSILSLGWIAALLGAVGVPLTCCAAETTAAPRGCFELVAGKEPATIVLAKTEHKGLLAAAKDLQRDITKITGLTPNIVHSLADCAEKCVVLGSADCPEGKSLLASVGLEVGDLEGQWETYKWRVLNDVGGKRQVLAIAGSNVRGSIFGVYEFERLHMQVDPFWFWADHEPPTRGELVYDATIDFGPSKEPTWKYRGWTLNDHPQLIEWMESGILQRARYGRYAFAIHHEVIERLCEAALRLKMNMFTWYFIDIDWQPDYERLQAVADRGLLLTQHQMESVGADTGFWDTYWRHHHPAGKPKEFSYRLHPEAFREFWSYYIRRWAEFSPQVVWEINLRGWADGPYTESSLPDGGTDQQRAEIIAQALADQARLVRQLDPNPDVEMMTTLYNEMADFYDQGWLTVPDGVTTGFADFTMNGMAWAKKFWTEPRDPKRKYGQYFHTQYFGGGPQIAKCTPIDTFLKPNFEAMYQHGDTQHMLLAMNELRHQQIEIRGIAEMLWDYPAFDPREYQLRYCRDEFGDEVADRVLALYDEYYQKYPHKILRRPPNPNPYPSYEKVMEPLFTVIGNLLNIESGNRDGFVLNYRYDRAIYEQGIRDLGQVLDKAIALRPSIPDDRRGFFDYEFIDAIQQIRGIYRISIAVNDAIACLKKGDRAGALAALNDARPLVDALYASYQNNCAGEKWRYWYRSGTNEDVYLMYNLYQKARLSLEVEPLNLVAQIEPQRHPFRGNVVMHDPAGPGDAVYSSQAERLNGSVFNGAPYSILAFPLHNAFQIGGVQSTYRKWKEPVPDYGLAYRFTLRGPAVVYVAKQKGRDLDWLAKQGFQPLEDVMEVGHWGWPYRYRNRPPDNVYSFELYAKPFPAGEVVLGKNPSAGKVLPYIVFIQPRLMVFENFRRTPLGHSPTGWAIEPNGGRVEVVANPDYEGQMRPSVFDLSTVPRYRPLGLKSLRLTTTDTSTGAATAQLPLRSIEGDYAVQLRVKPGQTNVKTGFALVDAKDQILLEVAFGEQGRIVCQGEKIATAPFKAGRWYNVLLCGSPDRHTFSLVMEDDQAHIVVKQELRPNKAGDGRPAAIRLIHAPGRPGSWIEYGAVGGLGWNAD